MAKNNSQDDVTSEGTIIFPDTSKDEEIVSIGIPSTSGDEVFITIGGSSLLYKQSNITQKAWEYLNNNAGGSKHKIGSDVLKIFDKVINSYSDIDFPVVDVFPDTDSDIINFQWDVDDTTLGIGINSKIEDCFWFMLSGIKDTDIRARGGLYKPELLIPWLLFIMERKARG